MRTPPWVRGGVVRASLVIRSLNRGGTRGLEASPRLIHAIIHARNAIMKPRSRDRGSTRGLARAPVPAAGPAPRGRGAARSVAQRPRWGARCARWIPPPAAGKAALAGRSRASSGGPEERARWRRPAARPRAARARPVAARATPGARCGMGVAGRARGLADGGLLGGEQDGPRVCVRVAAMAQRTALLGEASAVLPLASGQRGERMLRTRAKVRALADRALLLSQTMATVSLLTSDCPKNETCWNRSPASI